MKVYMKYGNGEFDLVIDDGNYRDNDWDYRRRRNAQKT